MSEVHHTLGSLLPGGRRPEKPKTRRAIEPGLYENLKTGAYEGGWRDPATGKAVLKTLYNDPVTRTQRCENVTQARRALRKLRGEVEAREVVAPNKRTLAQQGEHYLTGLKARVAAGELEQSTLDLWEGRLRLHLLPELGSRRVQDIGHKTIEDLYDAHRLKGLSLSTRVNIHQILRKLLEEAVGDGIIGVSPMNRVKRDKTPRGKIKRRFRVLTHEECQKLIAEVKEEFRMVVTLLCYTGMRVGEGVELRWFDCDMTVLDGPNLIKPRRSSRHGVIKDYTKTSKRDEQKADEREVPVLPFLDAELLLHLEAEIKAGRGQAGDLVTIRSDETPFEAKEINEEVKRAAKKIGIAERFTTHMLRHTFLSNLARTGTDVVHVSKIAGHSSPAVTLGLYMHFFNEGQAAKLAVERCIAGGFGVAAAI